MSRKGKPHRPTRKGRRTAPNFYQPQLQRPKRASDPADDPMALRRRSQEADAMLDRYKYVPEDVNTVMRALDWHLAYFEWQGTDEYVDRMEAFANTYFGNKLTTWRGNMTVTEGLCADETRIMQLARTTWVQADICTYLEAAAQSMPPSIIRYSDLPYDTGFIVFERPILYWDHFYSERPDEEIDVPLRALAWAKTSTVGNPRNKEQPRGEGLMIWLYTDRDFCNAAFKEAIHEAGQEELEGPPMILLDITGWLFDDEVWSEDEGPGGMNQSSAPRRTELLFGGDEDAPHDPKLSRHMSMVRKYLLALFLFMKQEIVGSSEERPPRPAKRRAERAGMAVPDSILVIHLRRRKQTKKEAEEEGEHGTVEWSHRWISRAHWRTIHDKEGRPRVIPVRESIKGPEDKPLIIKERIISVDR